MSERPPLLTTMAEMRLLEQFASWLGVRRQSALKSNRAPWRYRVRTRNEPGLEEFTVELSRDEEPTR